MTNTIDEKKKKYEEIDEKLKDYIRKAKTKDEYYEIENDIINTITREYADIFLLMHITEAVFNSDEIIKFKESLK